MMLRALCSVCVSHSLLSYTLSNLSLFAFFVITFWKRLVCKLSWLAFESLFKRLSTCIQMHNDKCYLISLNQSMPATSSAQHQDELHKPIYMHDIYCYILANLQNSVVNYILYVILIFIIMLIIDIMEVYNNVGHTRYCKVSLKSIQQVLLQRVSNKHQNKLSRSQYQ